MEFVVIFLISLITIYVVLRKTNHKLKDHNVKKNEIIEEYESELKLILENDKENQAENKKIFLKKCNDELSRNIFFTETEASNIIQKLAKL